MSCAGAHSGRARVGLPRVLDQHHGGLPSPVVASGFHCFSSAARHTSSDGMPWLPRLNQVRGIHDLARTCAHATVLAHTGGGCCAIGCITASQTQRTTRTTPRRACTGLTWAGSSASRTTPRWRLSIGRTSTSMQVSLRSLGISFLLALSPLASRCDSRLLPAPPLRALDHRFWSRAPYADWSELRRRARRLRLRRSRCTSLDLALHVLHQLARALCRRTGVHTRCDRTRQLCEPRSRQAASIVMFPTPL